jgi:hypothetical protein
MPALRTLKHPTWIGHVLNIFPKLGTHRQRTGGLKRRVGSDPLLLPPRRNTARVHRQLGLDLIDEQNRRGFGILQEFRPQLLHAHFPPRRRQQCDLRENKDPFPLTSYGYDIYRAPADFEQRAAAA